MALAVLPAQATNTRSASAALTWLANGVKSVALAGTAMLVTVAPAPPITALTASTLDLPNAESGANTTTFLPLPRYDLAVWTSWYDCRPERKVYRLSPVIASAAAGPETNSTLLAAASGATCN